MTILKHLNLDIKDKYYLAIILILSTILTVHYINFTINLGIFCSDVYVYLVNGLYFAGENVNAASDLWLTPLTCILTSFFFDLGFKSQISIFIVTGFFAIIGNIGLYLLFRLKFDKLLSFLGVIIYATFSLNLIWLANGSIDIPAASLTIWTVLLSIIAIDKNPKYYIWAIIMFLLAFFIRYPAILILPPIFLYFLFKKKYKAPWSELKYLIIPLIAIIIGGGAIIAVATYLNHGNLTVIQLGLNILQGKQGGQQDPAFNENIYYYAQNFFNFLSSGNVSFYKNNPQLNNPTIISAAYGIILFIGGIITLKDNRNTEISKKYILLTAILSIITAISFITFDSTITICLMLITMISTRKIFKSSKFDLNIMFVSWMLIYFIFYSYINFKVNRYFIPALPVVSYFIIYAIYKIQNKIKINKCIIPIILTIILLFTAFNFVNEVESTNHYIIPEQMSDYIINEIPDYKDEKIGSNTVRPYKWYLEKSIFPVRTSDINRLYDNNITYYIVNEPMDNLVNYTELKNIDGTYLYKNINS